MIPIILLYALTLWQGGPPPPGDPWWCTATGQTFLAHNPGFKGDDKGCKTGQKGRPLTYPDPVRRGDCFVAVSETVLERADCALKPMNVAPPFDVPPVDMTVEVPAAVTGNNGSYWYYWYYEGVTGPLLQVVGKTCEDPSRFMLKSEDGKFHCIRLIQ